MKVGIIGSGTMGSGIAQVAATSGCEVSVFEVKKEIVRRSKTRLDQILGRLIEKGRMDTKMKDSIQQNIRYVDSMQALKGSDLVIEAIVENLEIKKKVFKDLESIVGDDCIIASNTSSLSIASLAASLEAPERFIGLHFFNPAPIMKLVEVIPAVQTSTLTQDRTMDIAQGWDKLAVLAKDTPAFIVNKCARPFYGEALRILEEGIADVPTIDWVMKKLGGFRMGPFELMDFVGNDVNYTVTETVFKAFYYDGRYKPAFTQKRMVEAGYLGRKSGRGFYDYTEGAIPPVATEDPHLGQVVLDRMLAMLINESADTLHLGIASKEDIDLAMTKGVNYPKGMLHWADEIGIETVVERIDSLFDQYREERYRCCPLLRRMAEKGERFFD